MFNIKVAAAILVTSTLAVLGAVNPAQAGSKQYQDSYQSGHDSHGRDQGENQYDRRETPKSSKHDSHDNGYKKNYHPKAKVVKVIYKGHEHHKSKNTGAKCYDRPCYNSTPKPKSHHQH